jgi:uncharacterized protein YceH (UPF0502 family)
VRLVTFDYARRVHFSELTAPEQRVLGCLIEKRFTTPDQYPLTLNALRLACNQSTNRDPVTSYDEETVRAAADRLTRYGLARFASGHSSRATKYRHLAEEALQLDAEQLALLCVLLLRGPQTPGELRGRTERMHRFEEISDVTGGLQKLMEREPPLVALLPRQPGSREARYAHLLSGQVESLASAPQGYASAARSASSPEQDERIERLEATVAELRNEIAALRQKIEDLFA